MKYCNVIRAEVDLLSYTCNNEGSNGYVCKFITATNIQDVLENNVEPNGTRPHNCGFVKLQLSNIAT